jgi:thiol-disulfide isomerase/thioredoxin
LAVLKDQDTGFLYNGHVVRETTGDKQIVLEADLVQKFLSDYKEGRLHAYLKTEKQETEPFFEGNFLRVYGSNFISLVKERKYAEPEELKGLILMFTKKDCHACDWLEAYFDRVAQEYQGDDFQFAIMDVDENQPTPDLRQFLYNDQEPMLQFLAVLPDGGNIKRFQKENDTYDRLAEFVENVRYLVREQKSQAKPKQVEAEKISEKEDASTTDEL